MKALLTDHPWPDVLIETDICAAAGIELIAGPVETRDAHAIEADVAKHQPDAILCCWSPVSATAIRSAKHLRLVARLGVGLDNIAVDVASECGAWVTNVPDYCVEEVSDHTVAMLLDLWRGITAFDREAKLGKWNPASANLKRVREMTVGVVGYGRIGKLTALKLSRGFGVRVLVNSPSLLAKHREGEEIAPDIRVASLQTLQKEADGIVLHLPLNATSRHLINEAFINALARKPILVNVSRGGLIDNAALIRALDTGKLRGAALDVVDGEPSPPATIMGRSDIVVTPHVAFSSNASLEELRRRCSEEVVRVLRGERPLHPCNTPGQQ